MIKVKVVVYFVVYMENVISLGKLIGLVLFCPPHFFFVENSKNTRNELTLPVMGTIFLVYIYVSLSTMCQNA